MGSVGRRGAAHPRLPKRTKRRSRMDSFLRKVEVEVEVTGKGFSGCVVVFECASMDGGEGVRMKRQMACVGVGA